MYIKYRSLINIKYLRKLRLEMNQQEIEQVGISLTKILNNNNDVRKQGEDELLVLKSTQPDKYAAYLVAILSLGKPFATFHYLMSISALHINDRIFILINSL